MNTFPKTRAAAGYAARHGPASWPAPATILLARLGACEDFLPAGDIAPAGGDPRSTPGGTVTSVDSRAHARRPRRSAA